MHLLRCPGQLVDLRSVPSQAPASFRADLLASLGVWRRFPALPIISVVLFTIPVIVPARDPLSLLLLPITLFSVGWVGTQRIWYLRAFRGESISRHELWELTSRFFWPFVRLGLLTVLPVAPIVWIELGHPLLGSALIAGLSLAIDFALTFVAPWVAYQTPLIRQALVQGLRDVRRLWPRDRLYVLVPPFALLLVFRLISGETGSSASIAGTAASALLGLWFKGAVARFFLRAHDVLGDGWVSDERTETNVEAPGP
jgi:hypothetical protein